MQKAGAYDPSGYFLIEVSDDVTYKFSCSFCPNAACLLDPLALLLGRLDRTTGRVNGKSPTYG